MNKRPDMKIGDLIGQGGGNLNYAGFQKSVSLQANRFGVNEPIMAKIGSLGQGNP
jgi:hypothetical protein